MVAPNTEVSHCCREGSSVSFTERQESSGNIFSQKLQHSDGSDLSRVSFTLVVGEAIFWDICGDLLRVCERSKPRLVKYVGSGIFFLLQEYELRIEEESAFFWKHLL